MGTCYNVDTGRCKNEDIMEHALAKGLAYDYTDPIYEEGEFIVEAGCVIIPNVTCFFRFKNYALFQAVCHAVLSA